MQLIIQYLAGYSITLEHVESILLLGDRHLQVKCFGNEPVIHAKVESFMAQFSFDK